MQVTKIDDFLKSICLNTWSHMMYLKLGNTLKVIVIINIVQD